MKPKQYLHRPKLKSCLWTSLSLSVCLFYNFKVILVLNFKRVRNFPSENKMPFSPKLSPEGKCVTGFNRYSFSKDSSSCSDPLSLSSLSHFSLDVFTFYTCYSGSPFLLLIGGDLAVTLSFILTTVKTN